MDKSTLEKINRFTRREFTEDEVYAFPLVLCDNEIDRDGEKFSDKALEKLAELFIGRTGVFDHDAKSSNQSARIFDTEVVTDDSKKNRIGETYRCLKGYAYIIRTDENRSLISEIDGGIKREVSISCSAGKKVCSVCGNDRNASPCAHAKGRTYGGKLCFTVLDDITDAYEWSFVAVPAQVNAGVTKKSLSSDEDTEKLSGFVKAADSSLRSDIRRLAFIKGGAELVRSVTEKAASLETPQLISLRDSLAVSEKGLLFQLGGNDDAHADSSCDDFLTR